MSVHIGANPGDFAKTVLMPGDPMRAKYIAENFFDDVVCVNKVRGMYAFTGTYKGHRVSSMGSGMGIPQISIYLNELYRDFGVENVIRVGTAGGSADDVDVGDVILAVGSCTNSGINKHIFPGDFAPIADFELLNAAYETAGDLKIPVHVGLVSATDMFYTEKDEKRAMWKKYGVLASDMESSAIYTVSAKWRKRSLTMLTCSDKPGSGKNMTSEEREKSLGTMIGLALDTAIKFD